MTLEPGFQIDRSNVMIRNLFSMSDIVTKLLCKIGKHDYIPSCRNGGIIPTVDICIICFHERKNNGQRR